uniref:shieldin complex subunit 2 isoform X2 n=1 Tax=Doryrhamphus excisus TaxID=161450 RepID=UPI0025AE3749|nr:shieldin complex subunit 2 isoform X2 [Doryrhamphus excisus]XP_057915243.1 shieldin complex subunit 2 isoform X2 [Doryrhamphus excisus]XP_057915252.1 shieldin complex subunit 2 isoform X2 [Doryrhamphus excisus]XP_057915258.1 shieldin complex subunit 2 isoform X2 [Doryrhamphus excisus]
MGDHPAAGDTWSSPGVKAGSSLSVRHLEPTYAEEEDQNNTKTTDQDGPDSRTEQTAETVERHQPNSDEEDQCAVSVQEYLDSCFPAAHLEQTREPQPSTTTQYLATWTLSQALILRGSQSTSSLSQSPQKHIQTSSEDSSSTPDLFSPSARRSTGGSDELFSPERRAEQGGVVLEATSHGVLCSQEDSGSHSSPRHKRTRLAEDVRTEASASDGNIAAGLHGFTTLLKQCAEVDVRYRVLVVVVHPCQLKEVKVKSGPSTGTLVPLATMVVTDQSAMDMKVVLWRRAAFWALTVSVGDVVFITGLQLREDTWRGEKVLQSTFGSKLLNLGHIGAPNYPPGGHQVHARFVASLCDFLRERRPLLLSVQPRPPQDQRRLPYAHLWALKVNMLVHALLRVKHAHMSTEWRGEAESCCRSALERQVVVTVEQANSQQGALLLWGTAVDWLPRFRKYKDAVWDIRFLLVREGLTSDLPELHTTPWSSIRLVDDTDRRLQDFMCGTSSCVDLDLDTLLSQSYSGDVLLRVQVISFRFQPSHNAPQPTLHCFTPPPDILAALSGDITYSGCARCSAELDTDANGIYGSCYPCLPYTAVRRYYRPGVLTVSGQSNRSVCIQVPAIALQKILDAPPDELHRSSAPGSEVKHIEVAAQRLQNLLSLPRKTITVTVRSLFLRDENSVPISQELTLLDLQISRT